MGRAWESILLGYDRKLKRDGCVVIPNYKLMKKFTSRLSVPITIEKIRGSLKQLVDKNTRSTLMMCPSLFFKYADSGRVHQVMSIEEFINSTYHYYCLEDRLEYIIELEKRVEVLMNPLLSMKDRYEALSRLQIWGPMHHWMYYKMEYNIKIV